MARIACLNNYPLLKMLARAAIGEMPAQHVWAVDQLARAGHDVRLAPFHEPFEKNVLQRLSASSRTAFGQVDQEIWAVRQRPDVIYAADQRSARGFALVASPGRLVSVVHHPVEDRWNRRIWGRHAHIVCLSTAVADQLIRMGIVARRVSVAPWGPDLRSPVYVGGVDGGGVVSAGKSNRDLPTLVTALERTQIDGVIYDLAAQIPSNTPGVTLIRSGGHGADPASPAGYLPRFVYDRVRDAGIVAIPISNPNRLSGLTELNDALAFGKPVVITRSPYLPIDVEKIGCGRSVEPGDVVGWVEALRSLRDPQTRADMGAAGKRFAEDRWNYDSFCDAIDATISEALG